MDLVCELVSVYPVVFSEIKNSYMISQKTATI